jgi:hypothetical protein
MIYSLNASEKIGLKGFYLGEDKTKACERIKDYMAKVSTDSFFAAQDGHNEQFNVNICGYVDPFYYQNLQLYIIYDDNNKITGVTMGTGWVNDFFNVHQLSGSKLADLLIDNVSWLSNGLDGTTNGWIYQNFDEGWQFNIDENKMINYGKLEKPNFN